MSTEFYWVAVVVTTILAASRLTRLATVDKFPPAAWVRTKWANLTDPTDWFWLFHCGYCFSFWGTAFVVGTGALGHVYGHPPNAGSGSEHWLYYAWWALMGTLAMSYLAAIVMANDGDEDED